MTETSILWATNGTGDGTGSGYTADNLFQLYRALFAGVTGTDLAGVAPDYLNKLAVTGSSSPLSVDTGAALVYGVPYFNSAAVSVAVPTPASATRIDRIVLRASWSAQTVRVTRVAGTEGAGAPNLTQSQGVTWDMPLAQVSITTGGVITITDEREFLRALGDSGVSTAKLADLAVTTAKIADSAVTSAKIADGTIVAGDIASDAVTTVKILDANVTTAKIADLNVTTGKLAASAVTTAKVADGNVTSAKLADMAQATVKGRAAAAGTGVPGDLTAAQLVTIITAADGAGTGLDADTLDGSHAAAFAAAAHSHGTSEIAAGAVTNAKLADMAQATIKGRAGQAGTGTPTDLTAAQVVTIITAADGAGSLLDADTVDGSHATAFAAAAHSHSTSEIADDSISNTKLANMAQSTVKGRAVGAGTGDPTDLTAAQLTAIVNSSNVGAWTTLTLESGATHSTNNGAQYRLVGDVVEFRGSVRLTASVTTLVANMPGGYQQPTGRFIEIPLRQGTAYLYVTGSLIYIYSGSTGNDYSLHGLRYSVTT